MWPMQSKAACVTNADISRLLPFWVKPPAIPQPLTAAISTRDIFARRAVVACMGKIQGGPV